MVGASSLDPQLHIRSFFFFFRQAHVQFPFLDKLFMHPNKIYQLSQAMNFVGPSLSISKTILWRYGRLLDSATCPYDLSLR